MNYYLWLRRYEDLRPRLQLAHLALKIVYSLGNLQLDCIQVLKVPRCDGLDEICQPGRIPTISHHGCLKDFVEDCAVYQWWACRTSGFHSIL